MVFTGADDADSEIQLGSIGPMAGNCYGPLELPGLGSMIGLSATSTTKGVGSVSFIITEDQRPMAIGQEVQGTSIPEVTTWTFDSEESRFAGLVAWSTTNEIRSLGVLMLNQTCVELASGATATETDETVIVDDAATTETETETETTETETTETDKDPETEQQGDGTDEFPTSNESENPNVPPDDVKEDSNEDKNQPDPKEEIEDVKPD